VKLFSKNSNLCEHGTVPAVRHRQTYRQSDAIQCIASRGEKKSLYHEFDLIFLETTPQPYILQPIT